MATSRKLKIWLRDPLPVRVTIKGIEYEIRPDAIAGGRGCINLEAVRLDNGKCLPLEPLPASWYREEYDRHAWFESLPGRPSRKLADALLAQGLAVTDPPPTWFYRYEHDVLWPAIALGCEFHHDADWHKKTSEVEPTPKLLKYFIRY